MQTIYHSCNQNTPTVIPYSGFPMKTRHLHKTRMFHKKKQKHVPRGHVKSLPLGCRAHWRFLAHFCSNMNCGGVADSPPLWTKIFFSLLCSRYVFLGSLESGEDPFQGPAQQRAVGNTLPSPADAPCLFLGVVRVHCTWEADLDLCHPSQTTRYAPARMAHAVQPASHTSAPASATAVNHSAEPPVQSQRQALPLLWF